MTGPNPNNLTCIKDYTFHACPWTPQKPAFIGCCSDSVQDPCISGCGKGNISHAEFPPELYQKFPYPSCPPGSKAIVCSVGVGANKASTYWACCGEDEKTACTTQVRDADYDYLRGCSTEMVDPFLTTEYQLRAYGLLTSSSSSSSRSSAAAAPTESVSKMADDPPESHTHIHTTLIATETVTSTPAPSAPKSTSTGLIAGSAVGGVLGLALLGLAVAFLVRRARNLKDNLGGGEGGEENGNANAHFPDEKNQQVH